MHHLTTPTSFYATVVLDDALDKPLDYSIPEPFQRHIAVGSRVIIPLKTSLRKGTIWELKHSSPIPSSQLKEIHSLASEDSILTQDLILLSQWMASYYSAPMHKVLQSVLPASIRNHMKECSQKIVVSLLSLDTLSDLVLRLQPTKPKQAALLSLLQKLGGKAPLSTLISQAKASGATQATLSALEKQNILSISWEIKERAPSWDDDYFISPSKSLSSEQEVVVQEITQKLQKKLFSPHLLYGITGSGKTEIYLQLIAEALSLNQGVIFLVPEVALTSQTIERLKSRFQEKIALLHYRLSEGEKRDAWHSILSRKARIAIGARSAVFSPMPNLGLIIVDEEHDAAYKKTGDSPAYHARDIAIVRAKFCQATVILGSATPSLESYQNAITGKYHLNTLTKRLGKAQIPSVQIVDMKPECLKHKGFTLFSDPLLSGIKKRIKSGEQTLLLLNRRGYHTSQICLHCSFVSQCPHCETSLTFHQQDNLLSCHHCDYQILPPHICPSCGSPNSLKFQGFGTEFVEKQLHVIFPSCRTLRMDADTTKRKGSHETLFRQFKSGKADILVGTQMIAKGLHFPSVTLVGVLSADLSLCIPDFRASETLFQLLTQVAGRAGRGELLGEVIIQTFEPEQATLKHAMRQDYLSFFQEEIEVRKLFCYPPFTHLIKILVSGPELQKTEEAAQEAKHRLLRKLPPSFEFLPVTPCGHAKLQNQYRFQFLIKTTKILAASHILLSTIQQLKRNHKSMQFLIDVDPSSTFF